MLLTRLHTAPLILVAALADLLAAAELPTGFSSLFNGRSLAGWESTGGDATPCWKVDRGILVCTGSKGPSLRTTEEFGDFCVRLEYKLGPGGNSGVYLRVPADGNHHDAGSGIEVQILDDGAERYRNLQPYQCCGSIYGIATAKKHVASPVGEWNTLEINCLGHSYRIVHNGVVVVDASADDYPELKERRVRGYLGLQNHREEIWFRNLILGPPQPRRDEEDSR
jgi:hypothetical protein